jgi:RNA polymerase sigma-70 factor (sigma-E family)
VPAGEPARAMPVTDVAAMPGNAAMEHAVEVTAGWSADEAVTRLFTSHYRPLVRLAALLMRDSSAAEEVVQDAFVGLHRGWPRLRDPDRAVAYLRQSVVNRSRSAMRHRGVVDRFLRRQHTLGTEPSAEAQVLAAHGNAQLLAALDALPARQREALVLRYYCDLSEAQTAAAMGISHGAVKSHTARGIAALRQGLPSQAQLDDGWEVAR